MLNSIPNLNSRFFLNLIVIILSFAFSELSAQCNLTLTDYANPTSCYATDGYFTVESVNNGCNRFVRVYKNNVLIAQGNGLLTVQGLAAGDYEVIAANDCSCPTATSRIVTLFAGNPTPLTAYVNKGTGFYQSNQVYVCKGSDFHLGIQSVGITNVSMSNPYGFSDTTPNGSTYWTIREVQPDDAGIYTISYTNPQGCISSTEITVVVGDLSLDAGPNQTVCQNSPFTINPIVSGQATCQQTCPSTLDSLLVSWTLDQCNANGFNNQLDYSEFLPTYGDDGNCQSVNATNVYRNGGDHSCTPIPNSYVGDIGMCVMAEESCNPNDYNPTYATKFEVTLSPQQAGRITKLTFKEQSPLNWITTNGATGVNNYNTKYQIRVYKNDILIYSENELPTEFDWNLEEFDFSTNPDFTITETTTFRFELRGYCVVNNNGNMSGWELDDIKIYGGCCTGLGNYSGVDYLWSTGATTSSITFNPSAPSTYFVTVTDCKGCSVADSININIFPLPIPSITGDLTICVGETTRLTASGGTSYVWNNGEITSVIDVNPTETTSYSVTVTDANGCQASTNVTVIVNPLPTPSITGDLTICVGETTRLTASGGSSYIWNNGVNVYWQDVNPTETTSYSVTVTDANGCQASTNVTVIVNPLPTPSITGDLTICVGETTRLTASGGSSYIWNNGVNVYWQDVIPTETTTYSVTVTDANGCQANTNVTVIVNPLPTPSITGDLTICEKETTRLTASGGTSYVWNNGVNVYWQDVNPTETTTYSVTVTDGNGCQANTNVTVIVNPLPTPSITGDLTICEGETTRLTASGGTSYVWNNGEITSVIDVNPTITTTYAVTVTDANGCQASTNVTVIVNPLPTPSISGDLTICFGETTRLTASGGTSYVWNNGVNVYWQDVNPTETTTYSVTVTDANGCQGNTSVTVVVNPLPTPIITGDLTICEGETTRLTASGGTSYVWNNGVNVYWQDVNPTETTTYSVTVTDSNGCQGNTSVTVVVNPLPTPSITGDLTICEGETTRLTASGGTSYVWNNGVNVYWQDVNPIETTTYSVTVTDANGCQGNTSVTVVVNPLPTPIITGDLTICEGETTRLTASGGTSYVWNNGVNVYWQDVNPTETTTYSVTVTDANGCQGSTNVTVVVNPLPIPSITGDLTICEGETTRLTASGGTSYVWNNGVNVYWQDVNPTETTTYSVTVTDANGCQASTNVTVIVNPLPTPSITGDLTICEGETTRLTASGGTSYVWNNGVNVYWQDVNPTETTTYSVTVTDANGCQASTSVTVVVNPLPTPIITGDLTICVGETTRLTASGGTSYVWNNGVNVYWQDVNPTETTTYYVTVTDANGCQASTYVTVIVNPLPTPSITGDLTICVGETTRLTATGGTSYIWSNGVNVYWQDVNPTETTTYSVTVTDANGCQGNTSVTVVVNPLPTPNITGDLTICVGETTRLTATGGTSYVWNNGVNVYWQDVNPTETTTYSVTVTDANGCQGSTNVTVVVNPLPTPIITGDLTICVGETTRLTASGGTSYVWNNGVNVYWQDVNPTETTTYSVTVTDANGCQASASVTVIVNTAATATISGDLEICAGESTTLTANGGSNYLWSNGSTTAQINVSPLTNTVYSVTVSSGTGCQSETSVTVVVNPLPIATVSGNTEICAEECTTLTATGGLTYEWLNLDTQGFACNSSLFIGGLQGGANQSLYNISNAGQINLIGDLGTNFVNGIGFYCQSGRNPQIYAMKQFGTSQLEAVRANFVTVNPVNATVNILGEIPQPPNPYGALGTTGIMTFIGDISASGIYYFPAVSALIDPTNFQIIDYTFYLGSIDLNNHGNGANVTYKIISILPNCKLYMDNCIAAYQRFALDPSTSEPSGGIQDWALSPDGETLYSFFGIENGLFRMNINTATTSCLAGPASNASFTGMTGVQTDEFGGIYFQNGELFGYQMDRGRFYKIDQNDGTLTLLADDLPLNFNGDLAKCEDCGLGNTNPNNLAEVSVCPTETTTYTVVVTDAKGCTSSASITINVRNEFTPQITGDNQICLGESTTLAVNGGETFTWSTGASTASITVSPTETTNYSVTVLDINGCSGIASFTVNVNPIPQPLVVGDLDICAGETAGLFATGGQQYQWSNGESTAFIRVSPLATTTYTVTVTNSGGCQSSTSVIVIVNPLPTPIITGDLTICEGETTRLTASGGSSYIWNNGVNVYWQDVNPTETTTYSVTVTDANGCQGSTSVTVVFNPLPTPIITGDLTICVGETTRLTASGGTSYVWNNGVNVYWQDVNPTETTTYSVTVTDANGCQASASVTVIVNTAATATISGDLEICAGESTTLTANGGSNYLWSNGSTTAQINVSPLTNTVYSVTVSSGTGCQSETSVTVVVNPLPIATVSGNTEICAEECTTLTATGGLTYEWLNLDTQGFACNSSLFIGGLQGGANQSLYNISNAGQINLIGDLGTNFVNGIGFYCQSGRNPQIYAMKQFGTSQLEAVRANFVTVNPVNATVNILGEIPQPPNPYGALGTTGIMTFIGDISASGIYYFPAVSALIDPTNFQIIDYTFYLGSIDLNNHGNGANVTYKIISILPNCKLYMDNCIAAYQRFALDPSTSEPSGGIQDWALSPDGETLYSFFGIENGLFRMNINTATTSCLAGPASNASFTGMTGVQTDEFGGIYFQNGELFGYQMDRGRFYKIDQNDGTLTLLADDLPLNFNGDLAKCEDCGLGNTNPNNLAEVSVCPTETTTYTVVVTDAKGCTSSASITINVRNEFTPQITGDNQICLGESTTLAVNGGETFTWSTGASTASITVSPTETTNYSVTVLDINGCSGIASLTVNVNPIPQPLVVGDLDICAGETAGLFATGGQQYQWSNGESTAFIRVSPLATTTYTVTVTNSGGCQASTSVIVIVNPLPTPSITGDLTICVGETTRLTATGGTSYVWNNGVNVYWQDVNPIETTTYSVTVTDANGCQGSTNVTVVVNPLPTPIITGDLTICVGETTRLTASGGTSYVWNNGVNVYWQDVNPTETTTYSVTVTDANGCQASASVTVIVNTAATATISGDLEICAGESTTLTANGGSNYLWNNGRTTSVINVSPLTNTTYSVTVTSGAGCESEISVTVVVNPLPTPSITGDLTICVGETTRLTASGGTSYVWNNGEITSAIDVNPAVATTYTVTVTDANGCQASTNLTVAVNPLPTPIITGDLTICVGETTTLTAAGGITYKWNDGGNNPIQDVMPNETTSYTVLVTDTNGCQASASVTVVVNPLPIANIAGDLTICVGELTRLTATGGTSYVWNNGEVISTIDVNPTETTTYSVTVTDANGCQASTSVTVIVNPLPTPSITGDLTICVGETTRLTASVGSSYSWSNDSTSAFIDVAPTSTTTYSVTITNEFGCNANTSVVVTVNELPNIIITGMDKICLGDSTTLTATGGTSYVWSTGQTTAVIKVNPLVNTIYSVTVTNINGCVDSASYQVMIKPSPDVVISGPNGLCKGEETFLVVNGHSNNLCENVCNIDNPSVLAYWDLEACNSYMDLGTHLDYSEFVAVVNNDSCTQVTASIVNRLPGNKHSCTPGFDGNIGMCIGSQNTCNPSKADYNHALRFEVTIQPNQTGQITGLQFYEQSPVNYQFIDGLGGLNNFATKFLIRVSKNGSIIYYQDEIFTNRTWDIQSFNFEGNPLFKNNTTATYLFELIPYCTVDNGGLESVWDVDDIKVLGGCCASSVPEVMTYLWSNGATAATISVTPTETTTYTVTVTDCCGCSSHEEYVVYVSDLKVDLGEDETINLGQSITLNPTVTGAAVCDDQNPDANQLKYLWITGDTTSSITVTPNVSKFYRVTVTDCNECVDTESITIHIRMFSPLVTYPNPARDMINIVSETDLDPGSKVRILHANGNNVMIDHVDVSMENARNIQVNLPTSLPNGIYILELESGAQIVRQKLVVHKK
jgi:hypothetical protein